MSYMTIGYETPITLLLTVISFLIVLYAQLKINHAYSKYKKIQNNRGLTGQEVARRILDQNGLENVHIVEVRGNLTDHYDPTRKVVRLSTEIYNGTSIAALAVAAHECGHAIQDNVGYLLMRIRSSLVPVVNFISYIGYFSILVSLFFGIKGYLSIGLIILCATLLFQIVTLPVEINASARANDQVEKLGLIDSSERNGVLSVLKAAAMTYLASLVSTLLNVLRLLIMFRNRD